MTRRLIGGGVYLVVFCVGGQPPAWSDLIHLSGGRTLDGVVIRETPSHVEVQVAQQGYVTLSRTSILAIERESDELNQRLLARWQQDALDAQERERQRRAFEAAQRARGLVKYRGQWVSVNELAVIKAEEAREERRRLEERLTQLSEKFESLQAENDRLTRLVAHQQLLLSQPRLLVVPHDPDLFTDEHGNRLRIRRHEGHRFFVSPEGKHVDLVPHHDHLAFTDEGDVHRDLTRVSP